MQQAWGWGSGVHDQMLHLYSHNQGKLEGAAENQGLLWKAEDKPGGHSQNKFKQESQKTEELWFCYMCYIHYTSHRSECCKYMKVFK